MAVLHDDGLGLEVLVESLFTQVFSEPGHLEASEWGCHVSLVVGVDEAGPSVDPLGHAHGFVEVVGQNASSQAVLGGVGTSNHL